MSDDSRALAIQLTVHGRVQGVFYRDWTVATARELGIAGWVRNEADGTVAAHLEGAALQVDEMMARMRQGPPAARVDRIVQRMVAAEGHDGFQKRR